MKIQRYRCKPVKVTKAMIHRSVASSTAIETGESVKSLEHKLKTGDTRFRNLTLAS